MGMAQWRRGIVEDLGQMGHQRSSFDACCFLLKSVTRRPVPQERHQLQHEWSQAYETVEQGGKCHRSHGAYEETEGRLIFQVDDILDPEGERHRENMAQPSEKYKPYFGQDDDLRKLRGSTFDGRRLVRRAMRAKCPSGWATSPG